MNGYLLDTHVVLWWLTEPGRLPDAARETIASAESAVFVSAAAAWEMAIKKAIGRLEMPSNLPEVLEEERIDVLEVGIDHALAVADLPLLHQDPFDRLQVAQARIEDLVLVTHDTQVQGYPVEVLAV